MKLFVCIGIILLAFGAKGAGIAKLSNGELVNCKFNTYNCPSRNKKDKKRLRNCKDVKKVWNSCKYDIHLLDRDKDGIPCEESC